MKSTTRRSQESSTECLVLFGNRVTLYAFIIVSIVVTAIPNWYFNSRTGNPVLTEVFAQDPGLQQNAYVEAIIQYDQIKNGTIGTMPLSVDYKDVQVNYDKVKKEWNAN